MRSITVIGTGYLGATHAACMAELGFDVLGIDVDPTKITALAAGAVPFHEPGLPELLARHVQSGRLTFSTDVVAAGAFADVHFVCVGTPQQAGSYAADTSYVDAAFDALIPTLRPGAVVVGKSTVPVGTAARLAARLATEAPGTVLVWNPEFLREAHAVNDTLHPDRIVYGLPRDPALAAHATQALDAVYATALAAGTPRLTMDYATAELVKVSANSFLATKISFINAVAEVCEATGADVTLLAQAIGLDERIGPKFLGAGIGFGGGCLPKDIRAFMARADEVGAGEALGFLREVDAVNLRRRARVVTLTTELAGGTLAGKRVAVLGAAFKPDSDDVRDSPALAVAAQLAEAGADVVVTDPAAVESARRGQPQLAYADTLEDAAADADVVVLATEWDQYRTADPFTLTALVRTPAIVDARNVLEPGKWRAAGWQFRGLGRP